MTTKKRAVGSASLDLSKPEARLHNYQTGGSYDKKASSDPYPIYGRAELHRRNYSGGFGQFGEERTALEGAAQVVEHAEAILAQG